MDPVNLSVVMPCFNSAKTIEVQLQALARQQWDQPWELLVADNGSTDSTLEIVKRYQDQFPRLRIIDASSKRGAAHARNSAVKEARGDFIIFCDADDKVHDGWLAAMATALKDHDMVGGKFRLTELNEPWRIPQDHPFVTQDEPFPFVFRHIPDSKYTLASNLGIKKELHIKIGGFDEGMIYNQDLDYGLRAQQAGYNLHLTPDAVVEYRLRHDPWKTYLQAYRWARYSMLVYRRYVGVGTLINRLRFIFGGWKYLPGKLIRVRNKADWFAICAWVGVRIGEAQGCLEFLVFSNSKIPLSSANQSSLST